MSEVNELKRRHFLEQAIAANLLTLRDAYGIFVPNVPTSLKHQLLSSMIARIQGMTSSVQVLATLSSAEDMWVLVRSMCETSFNACYLWLAPEQEVIAYLAGSNASWIHGLKQFESVIGERFTPVSDQRREAAKTTSEFANDLAQREVGPRSWSEKGLEQRIEVIDKKIGLILFRGLYRSTYTTGHQYVHGNYRSIAYYHNRLLQVTEPEGSYSSEINLALSQAAQVTTALCVFLNFILDGIFNARLREVFALQDESHKLSGLPIGNARL